VKFSTATGEDPFPEGLVDRSLKWTGAAQRMVARCHSSNYGSYGAVMVNRRVSNGDQVNRIAHLALKRGKSVDFTGYWQRHIA
jgi:hypothetical protein